MIEDVKKPKRAVVVVPNGKARRSYQAIVSDPDIVDQDTIIMITH
jgi:hypothetical protein